MRGQISSSPAEKIPTGAWYPEIASRKSSTAGVSEDGTPKWAKDLLKQAGHVSKRLQSAQKVVDRSSEAAKHKAGQDATDEFFRSLLKENPSSRAAKQHFAKKRAQVMC